METVLPFVGLDEAAGRPVLIVLVVGFIPALIIAWVFEWTPEGLKLDADAGTDADAAAVGKRKLDRSILIVLTLAVGLFAVDKFLLDPVRDKIREEQVAETARSEAVKGFYGDRSIVVLPFANMSSDPEQEFFADGVSEEILNLLANIRELRVISRTSAFVFKDQNLEIRDIAERLDVAHILEGSVRKNGDDIRVTAQLIEARTDTHLWSETYDGKYKDVFALQDRIAEAVVKQALEIDPDHVPALELMIGANHFMNVAGVLTEEEMKAYRELEGRILTLDPDNGLIPVTHGNMAAWAHDNLESAARFFEDALRKNAADSNVVKLAGRFAIFFGFQDQATRLGEHSVAIDPMCYMCLYYLSRSYMDAGRYAEAEKMRERFMALSDVGGQRHYVLMKLLQGDALAALEFIESSDQSHPQMMLIMSAMIYFDLGRTDDANRMLDELIAAGPEWNWEIAEVAAWLKKNDLAFEFLHKVRDKSLEEDPAAIPRGRSSVFMPSFAKLHDDQR